MEYRTKISTLRGDYRKATERTAIVFVYGRSTTSSLDADDIFQERLYASSGCAQRRRARATITNSAPSQTTDLERERIVEDFVAEHLAEWQARLGAGHAHRAGRYKTESLIRNAGWTHWHHLFNPRQLLTERH